MPFPPQTPRPFTRTSIEGITPNVKGCYGLLNQQAVMIYVGQGDIRQRLLDHLNGDNSRITLNGAAFFVTMPSSFPETTEKFLIQEYNPVCNKKVG